MPINDLQINVSTKSKFYHNICKDMEPPSARGLNPRHPNRNVLMQFDNVFVYIAFFVTYAITRPCGRIVVPWTKLFLLTITAIDLFQMNKIDELAIGRLQQTQ